MESINTAKIKVGSSGVVTTADQVAISLTADGLVSITMPQDKFAATIIDSVASAGGKFRPPDDCVRVVAPCPRLSGFNLNDGLIRELIDKKILNEVFINSLREVQAKTQ